MDIELIKSSFELLKADAEKLAGRFYDELFKRHPTVKPLFEGSSEAEQARKLAAALGLLVKSLEPRETATGSGRSRITSSILWC